MDPTRGDPPNLKNDRKKFEIDDASFGSTSTGRAMAVDAMRRVVFFSSRGRETGETRVGRSGKPIKNV